ncbi:MAG: hypothetical protein DRP51_07600 [Candidatus Zixiibacteriota bacterium]|nr:MAG: hypothetical protein DRP51_07600 [candidate division Zixibacteria bacterium]
MTARGKRHSREGRRFAMASGNPSLYFYGHRYILLLSYILIYDKIIKEGTDADISGYLPPTKNGE